ncbi:MAG TPA: S1C family serine protease [Acidimicrobiales bacterium]|nr:S1C family serine protease [Acidimicrobiales bacterium]
MGRGRAGEGDGHDRDDGPWRRPPDPDDRLWRHPSEVAAALSPSRLRPAVRRARGRAVAGVMAGACVGAGLAAAAMVLIGGGSSGGSPGRLTSSSASRSADTFTPVVAPGRSGSTPTEADGASNAGVGPTLSYPLARVAESVVVVGVQGPTGTATGCGFSLAGGDTVVTATPLVRGATEISVANGSGARSLAVLLGADEITGVAVLRLTGVDLPALPPPGPAPQPDDVVLTYAPRATPPMAMGEVTNVGVDEAYPDGEMALGTMSTDLPVGDGCLGTPVFDSRARPVGMVVSAGAGRPTLVAPMSRTRAAADEITASGAVSHAWLGLAQTVATSAGCAVVDVVPGSPAAGAGITAGAMIVAVDGNPIRSLPNLWDQISLRSPGDAVDVQVQTGDTAHLVHVVLGRAPSDTNAAGNPGGRS